LEVFEKEDEYVVKAELPGMKKEEIDISVIGDTLTIKGERKAEEEAKEENYYLCERCYGSFERSLSLPTAVETGKAEAKPKKVEISVK
jgi:HSP20 family protein